ncbi:hypothetical protein [Planobispora takensis]
MGRVGPIDSGGASSGQDDLAQAVRTAVINKRAGGMGLIVGRESFQRPMTEGVRLLNAVQEVYLDDTVTIAEGGGRVRHRRGGRRDRQFEAGGHSAAAPPPVGSATRSPRAIIVMAAGTSQMTSAGYNR